MERERCILYVKCMQHISGIKISWWVIRKKSMSKSTPWEMMENKGNDALI